MEKKTNNEISIYNDKLTLEGIAAGGKMISLAFPSLENGFLTLLYDSLKRNKFTDKRFKDSVHYVIDNHVYPKPSIAEFISYDKKAKLLTHSELVNGMYDFDNYKRVNYGVKQALFASVEDVKNYNLELWVQKK